MLLEGDEEEAELESEGVDVLLDEVDDADESLLASAWSSVTRSLPNLAI